MEKKAKKEVVKPYGMNQLFKKMVIIVTLDGKKITGILTGVTKYEIYIEQVYEGKKTGQDFVVFKHAVKYIRWENKYSEK